MEVTYGGQKYSAQFSTRVLQGQHCHALTEGLAALERDSSAESTSGDDKGPWRFWQGVGVASGWLGGGGALRRGWSGGAVRVGRLGLGGGGMV